MKKMHLLGLMSGTSLDGLDMALCTFENQGGQWTYEVLQTGFREYSDQTRKQLQEAIRYPVSELLSLHREYGAWLGKESAEFLRGAPVKPDAIATHGHTIHHRPDLGFTFQLGCPQQVALGSGLTAIGDFRSLDVALGGQGAPLVPVGDRLLFDQYRFCLNLGGIANVSFEAAGERRAFDIGIANMLLNHLCAPLGLDFDRNGALARSGKPNLPLLRALDSLPYYRKPYPKSTGYEWFREAILPLLDRYPDTPENQLHTAVHHIARKIGEQLKGLGGGSRGGVLVTGGGAFNTYLLEVLQGQLGEGLALVVPETTLVAFKEALVFAFLGALRLAGQNNVLASVTGARRDSCSGVVYLP
ncbi:anhydro-N-acetylmuramic acid kinase [Robiginitalea marina]|uniref:Anhydro-N-acetylmuramic acid kinase n=1 Tax=Robiginitalea marina TaxID=2954105 RepID=A0ABT1AZF6_9FLAO|nr:anhydro-N-acetylmuramic acid kinase [Robiginitalea marina]MCO5725431.1 anhydro-N-acetylmuramic acid kinase [Robiginitalea marina]